MAQVVITINRREYAIACENGEELQILKLAKMLDEKAVALTKALGQINETQLLAMVGLIIADELSEAKKSIANLQKQNEEIAKNDAKKDDTLVSLGDDVVLAKDVDVIDEELGGALKSLSEAIKSIALNLKSL